MFGEGGEPMALLEKRNLQATRRSVLAWSVGTEIVFGVAGILLWLATDMPLISGFFVLPLMTVGGTVAGRARCGRPVPFGSGSGRSFTIRRGRRPRGRIGRRVRRRARL